MSPRTADGSVRTALIEAAARLLSEKGPGGLTTRRLAAAVDASTMAVYTHFEGMDDLRRAVRIEWFERLRERLSSVSPTADPVADLGAQGWAYFTNAVENRHMFRAMMLDPMDDAVVASAGIEALGVLSRTVGRCMDAGRLDPADPAGRALQIWMVGTGVIVAFLAGFVALDRAADHFFDTAEALLVAFGAAPEPTRASLRGGRRRMERRMKARKTV